MAGLAKDVRIEVVCTGNELLDGSISDTNSQRLAARLKPLGLKISKLATVPDDRASIAQAVVEAASRADVVFVSGGLGPTTDDMTLEVAAHALGKKMIFSAKAKQNVVSRLNRIKRKIMNPSQWKQFYIPEGAEVLVNREGTAPGVQMSVGKTLLFFLPGVPREFDHLLEEHIVSKLEKLQRALGEYLFVLKIVGKPESELNEIMKKIEIPSSMTVGYRTHLPENHIKLQVLSKSESAARREAGQVMAKIQKKLGPKAFSFQESSFAEAIYSRLLKDRSVVSIAESCTGGLISSMLTAVPGSSQVFDRGFVTYSYQSKTDLLGVNPKSLKRFGAVSEEVVTEMVKGALKNSNADRAVAVTGIAGPGGGTKGKPVGMVWIAAASSKRIRARVLRLGFSRELNQRFSAYEALRMLVDI